jgi:hypothetical protein
VHPEQLGGTRRLSAAQFVHDQRNAAALVASQDRRFTIFEWSTCEEAVHGSCFERYGQTRKAFGEYTRSRETNEARWKEDAA